MAKAYATLIVCGCMWSAAASALWPHTSFSGRGGEAAVADIEAVSRAQSPYLAEACRTDLMAAARQRARAAIAAGYPSSLRFALASRASALRYLGSDCPAGPYLAAMALAADGATDARRANGSGPVYALP
jgi:hypothetical protein